MEYGEYFNDSEKEELTSEQRINVRDVFYNSNPVFWGNRTERW